MDDPYPSDGADAAYTALAQGSEMGQELVSPRASDDAQTQISSDQRTPSQRDKFSPDNRSPSNASFIRHRTDNDLQRSAILSAVLADTCELHNNEMRRLEIEEDPDAWDPTEAMKLLLRHVKVDPDGGILNLDNDQKNTEQHSKVKALQKGTLEKGLAMFALFRTFANPCLVIYFAVKMIHGYVMDEPWIVKLEEATKGMRLPIPMGKCFIITSVAELLCVAFLLAKALRHGLKGMCYSGDTVEYQLHPRYTFLAGFYWHDLPYLQSVSSLAPLAFIHPNLLTKNVKVFSITEDIARAKLEAFLKVKTNFLTDETIVMNIVALVVNYDYKDGANKKREVASEYLDSRPSRALELLQNSAVAKDQSHLVNKGFDPDAISGCGYRCAEILQTLFLFFFALLCLLAGSAGFLTKLVRCFVMLMDAETSIYVAVAFFFAFLNQSMGIMSISRLLQWRIECFLFGGSDAYVSSEEEFIMRVYLGSLAEAVWKSNALTDFEKMCVMFQLDDDDIQQLVVEDSSHAKSNLVLHIRSYMAETRATSWWKDKVVAAFAK